LKKVIKIDEGNYKRLLPIIHEIEANRNERVSFDEVISILISEHEEKHNKNK
jgi:hypothetical protein